MVLTRNERLLLQLPIIHRYDTGLELYNGELSAQFFGKLLSADWNRVSAMEFPEQFFEQHIDKVVWKVLCKNPALSGAFFARHLAKIHWPSLCSNPNVDPHFLEQHLERINWKELSANTSLPEWFLDKYYSFLNKALIFKRSDLSEDFLERHQDKINWYYACLNPNVTLEFLERNITNINWNALCANEAIPEEFFEKYIEKLRDIPARWYVLCGNGNISAAFFQRHLDQINWNEICKNTSIPEEFFEANLEYVYWPELCSNSNISLDFFHRHLEHVIWDRLLMNSGIIVTLMENYDEIVTEYLSRRYPGLSLADFRLKYEGPAWRWLSSHDCLPASFFDNHFETLRTRGWSIDDLGDNIKYFSSRCSLEFYKNNLEKFTGYNISRNRGVPLSFYYDNGILDDMISLVDHFGEASEPRQRHRNNIDRLRISHGYHEIGQALSQLK